MVGKLGLEAHAAGGEVPLVLTVVPYAALIADVPLVLRVAVVELVVLLTVGQQGVVVVVVPLAAKADVEVAHVEVEERHLHRMLVVGEGVGLVAGFVEINVVVAVDVRYGGMEEAGGVQRPVHLSLQPLAQSHGQLQVHGHHGVDGQLGIGLQGHSLLGVVSDAQVERGFLSAMALPLAVGVVGVDDRNGIGDARFADGSYLPGQRHNLVPMGHGGFLAAAYQRIDGGLRETGGAIAFRIHADVDVRQTLVLLVFIHAEPVGNLCYNLRSRLQLVGRLRHVLDIDANDVVGTHLAGDVGREVVAHTTVYQHHTVFPHWCKDARYGHTGAHGPAQPATVEHILRVVGDIGGHTGKGNGQSIEVERVVKGRRNPVEERRDVPAPDEATTAALRPVPAEVNRLAEDIGIVLLAHLQVLVAVALLVRKQHGPVLRPHDGVEHGCRMSAGIGTTDDASHTGAGDEVDGHSGTFQHLQHADMRHALGSAATKHQSHLGALVVRAVRVVRAVCVVCAVWAVRAPDGLQAGKQ